jgi:hypothetical protein
MMQWCTPTSGQRMPLHHLCGSTTTAINITATPKSATPLWRFFKILTIAESKVFDYAYSRIHSQTKRKKSQAQNDAVCKNEGHLSRSQMVDVEVWHHQEELVLTRRESSCSCCPRAQDSICDRGGASYHWERKDPLKGPLEDPF